MTYPFPWDKLHGKPIIYASLGTLQNGLDQVFKTIGRVAGSFPYYQLVVSLGNVLTPEMIGAFPEDAIVAHAVPQVEILKRASLCITHAGLNTVLEALTYGVPLVAIPITNDQPGIASRIRHSKVGDFVRLADLTDEALERIARAVLSSPRYGAAALRMRDAIEKADGLRSATECIHSAFGTRKM
jgi:zeaxanthin glucosyltransferase